MAAKNRFSVSFTDEAYDRIQSISIHMQKSKSEIVRMIVEEHLENNPDRFRLSTKP